LDLAIIRKVSPVGQGCGSMTQEAAPPDAGKRTDLLVYSAVETPRCLSKFRQIRLEKRGGQHFDVQ
jgi:hypothetical protein